MEAFPDVLGSSSVPLPKALHAKVDQALGKSFETGAEVRDGLGAGSRSLSPRCSALSIRMISWRIR
ncbi:MAG: hypothetical protein AAGM22_08430 [Acidobacteriota bacterium]